MTNVNARNGSLKICKLSHRDGIMPFKDRKLGPEFSTQRIVDESYLNKYEIIDIEAEKRCVVHQYGPHSSEWRQQLK